MKKLDGGEIMRKAYPDITDQNLHQAAAIMTLCDEINSRFTEMVMEITAQISLIGDTIGVRIEKEIMDRFAVVREELRKIKQSADPYPVLIKGDVLRYTLNEEVVTTTIDNATLWNNKKDKADWLRVWRGEDAFGAIKPYWTKDGGLIG